MISKLEQSQIKSMLQSPQWLSVQRVADELCSRIKEHSCKRESEWETAKTVVEQEAQVDGIRMFIAELFNQAGQ